MEMDHPNIVKFHNCCYDNKYVNIVMELIHGIPLSDYIEKNDFYISEDKCQIIMRQFMLAVRYI